MESSFSRVSLRSPVARTVSLGPLHLQPGQVGEAQGGGRPEQALQHRQRGRIRLQVHRRIVIDHRLERARHLHGQREPVAGQRAADRERSDPAGRSAEVGVEGGGEVAGGEPCRPAGQLQAQFDAALAFGQPQQRRRDRKADRRGGPAAAVERRPLRQAAGERCAQPVGRVGHGCEMQPRTDPGDARKAARRGPAPITVLRTGANSCSTLVASLPAVKRASGVIATGAAPFFSSSTRCARSGTAGRGMKPSTRCIW